MFHGFRKGGKESTQDWKFCKIWFLMELKWVLDVCFQTRWWERIVKLISEIEQVDISTMLEEAVHYVKFLQLQIKASRTNTFGLKIDRTKFVLSANAAPELGWTVDVCSYSLQWSQRRNWPKGFNNPGTKVGR